MSNTPQNRHDNRRLPAGWRLADGRLFDPDNYARHVLNDAGRIDALRIAMILENYGEREHAAAWRGGPELSPEQLHGPVAIDALKNMVALATLLAQNVEQFPDSAMRDLRGACDLLVAVTGDPCWADAPKKVGSAVGIYGRTTVAPGAFGEVESGSPSATADR